DLSIAAVIGHSVPLEIWSNVSGRGHTDLWNTVEQAVGARLVLPASDGLSVTFTHALVREALYDGILPPLRRNLHQQIAEALIATGAPDADAVAHHLQRASDPRAAEWLILA